MDVCNTSGKEITVQVLLSRQTSWNALQLEVCIFHLEQAVDTCEKT